MFAKCPKCNYQRRPQDNGDAGICPSCGLVFAKWVQRQLGTEQIPHRARKAEVEPGTPLWERLTYVDERTDSLQFWGRVAIYVAFFVWGWYFILLDFRTNEIGESFMHRVNLVFHEAGHMIFMPFGRFIMILGGTLGQLIMPLVVMFALVIKNRDNFRWCDRTVVVRAKPDGLRTLHQRCA